MTAAPGARRANPVVAPIADYAARDAIADFVAAAIARAPEAEARLRDADEDRLVVVKPNWIQESREDRMPKTTPTTTAGGGAATAAIGEDSWQSVITHPQVVLAVVETLAAAMAGKGVVSICDAPHSYADFAAITARGDLAAGLDELRGRWPKLRIELLDLRREIWRRRDEVVVERLSNVPDPRGYVRLDLAERSLLHGHDGEGAYFGADYDVDVVNGHHHGVVQEYLLAGTPLAADLFVNLPTLKTHKKTGITGALKNLVGINGDKNWLPHHTLGSPATGGDEFPERSLATIAEGRLKRLGQRAALAFGRPGAFGYRTVRSLGKRALGGSETTIRNGNWSGNDTCWRMALDLNRCLLYGAADGAWRTAAAAKPTLCILDGIVAGEGNGPLSPEPVSAGVLASCANGAVLDAVAARLMGFAPEALPIVAGAFDERHPWPIADRNLAEIEVEDLRVGETMALRELAPAVAGGFEPHFGWRSLRQSER